MNCSVNFLRERLLSSYFFVLFCRLFIHQPLSHRHLESPAYLFFDGLVKYLIALNMKQKLQLDN